MSDIDTILGRIRAYAGAVGDAAFSRQSGVSEKTIWSLRKGRGQYYDTTLRRLLAVIPGDFVVGQVEAPALDGAEQAEHHSDIEPRKRLRKARRGASVQNASPEYAP